MNITNTLKRNNDENETRLKASKGYKWLNILETIREKLTIFCKKLCHLTIILPSDPNALLERLNLLLANKAAGNTGVRNELMTVCDKLLRQNMINGHTTTSHQILPIQRHLGVWSDGTINHEAMSARRKLLQRHSGLPHWVYGTTYWFTFGHWPPWSAFIDKQDTLLQRHVQLITIDDLSCTSNSLPWWTLDF